MIKHAEKLSQQMYNRLNEICSTGVTGLDYYKQCYEVTREAYYQLRLSIEKYKFSTEREEIEIFKTIIPKIHSETLYYIELMHIELQRPEFEERKIQLGFFKQQSNYYDQLLQRNIMLKLYHKIQREEEDSVLFSRKTVLPSFLPVEPIQEMEKNIPQASIELSKVIAYKSILKYVSEQIAKLKNKNGDQNTKDPVFVEWTTNKVALIELAYALHSAKCINNGKAEVKKIITALEQLFHVDLGPFYRTFQNIRIRQSSRTAFLDELKEKLIQRMDETDLSN